MTGLPFEVIVLVGPAGPARDWADCRGIPASARVVVVDRPGDVPRVRGLAGEGVAIAHLGGDAGWTPPPDLEIQLEVLRGHGAIDLMAEWWPAL